MADIFISYKSEDRSVVEDIVRGLKAEGLDVWWDQGIAPTTEWRAEIAQNLHAAKVVVVVWSRTTANLEAGKWVIQEAEEADGRGALAPVLIDDVLPPLGMRHRQAADLVDWRGDRTDPRWRGFVETVRAKLEGRAVDAAVARDAGGQTAGAMLKGRGGLLALALGLAALVVTSAIAFGSMVAAALVGGAALAFVVLNLLFSRRRGDRAAQTFMQRAFAVGWVATVVNVLVWAGAIGAGAWPYARGYLYADLVVTITDELRAPVPAAQVTVTLGERVVRVPLDAAGVGRVPYALFWGPDAGEIALRHNDYEVARPIARAHERFEDFALGVPSGVERLRISHVTLEELAIDAVLKGQLPPELQEVFPNVAGVVRNTVWQETDAFLNLFDPIAEGGAFQGAWVRPSDAGPLNIYDEEALGAQVVDGGFGSPRAEQFAALRWPDPSGISSDALTFSQYVDFSQGVVGCPVATPLDPLYRLSLGQEDGYYTADVLGFSPEARAALGRAGVSIPESDAGQTFGALTRVLDAAWTASLLDAARAAATRLQTPAYEDHRYMRFLANRQAPAGLAVASLRLSWRLTEGCDGVMTALAHVALPMPELRVSVIQNVSDVALPVEAIVQGVDGRAAIEVWRAGAAAETVEEAPWPGALLQPGQSIVVPRRLLLIGEMSPEEVEARRAAATGEAVTLQVISDAVPALPEEPPASDFATAAPDPDLVDYQRDLQARAALRAESFTIRAGQVAAGEAGAPVPFERDVNALYAVGPSVETLAVRINGVEFIMREDTGVTLAMIGSCECGSCPFVYASAPGQDAMLNHGPVITDLIGADAEGLDRIYLGRAVDAVELREVEPELSYVDRARLIVRSIDGSERAHLPSLSVVRAVDGQRARLAQGERLALRFPGYAPRETDEAVFLEVIGYYDPLPASARQMAALQRAGYRQN